MLTSCERRCTSSRGICLPCKTQQYCKPALGPCRAAQGQWFQTSKDIICPKLELAQFKGGLIPLSPDSRYQMGRKHTHQLTPEFFDSCCPCRCQRHAGVGRHPPWGELRPGILLLVPCTSVLMILRCAPVRVCLKLHLLEGFVALPPCSLSDNIFYVLSKVVSYAIQDLTEESPPGNVLTSLASESAKPCLYGENRSPTHAHVGVSECGAAGAASQKVSLSRVLLSCAVEIIAMVSPL